MEIRRFGIGYRRKEGPPGTRGVAGQGIFTDTQGSIAELAFGRAGAIVPHSNPNMTWFIVIEGGGFVRVGDEQARVAAGEAVLWPPNVLHAAWTEQTTMRAIVVELPAGEPAGLLMEGTATAVEDGARMESAPRAANGRLAPRPAVPQSAHHSPEEEPW